MPYLEDQLLPISALQHLLFCERQCALIHLEQIWAENRHTAEGRLLHEKAHDGPDETRPGIRIARGLPVHSLVLGLNGECDIVEFHGLKKSPERIVPVEYKRGKPKTHRADEVQLCAQALCLEEMLGVAIPAGALYYGTPRRRTEVIFDAPLRDLTRQSALRLHALWETRVTPSARKEKKCTLCSLQTHCIPAIFETHRSAADWFSKQLSSP